jgi:hypothetical protein
MAGRTKQRRYNPVTVVLQLVSDQKCERAKRQMSHNTHQLVYGPFASHLHVRPGKFIHIAPFKHKAIHSASQRSHVTNIERQSLKENKRKRLQEITKNNVR